MPFLMPDLSNNNPPLTLTQAQDKSISAIWFKASEGTGFRDPNLNQNVGAARNAQLPFGCYHFINSQDPQRQAALFLAVVPNDAAFLVVDWESVDPRFGTPATRQQVLAFLDELDKDGRPVAVYSGNYAREHGGYIPNRPAIVPAYGLNDLGALKPTNAPLAAWQYHGGPGSGNGTSYPSGFNGHPDCDMSVVYRADLLGLEDDVKFDDFEAGVRSYWNGDGDPGPNKPAEFSFGYRMAKRAETQPTVAPGSGGLSRVEADTLYAKKGHGHDVKGKTV